MPRFPLPLTDVSNGEFRPGVRCEDQRRVDRWVLRLADDYSRSRGLSRRRFLRSASGLAVFFLALNRVYGPIFNVGEAEAAGEDEAQAWSDALSGQFILDSQLHYVHDQFDFEALLNLRRYAARHWNRSLEAEKQSLAKFHFQNFLREVFLESDTTVGLLSGAPSDVRENWFLSNRQIVETRNIVNDLCGSRRMLGHFVITPGQPGWLDALDWGISELKPDSWKGYTVGDPLSESRYPYRLDDEDLMYPAYEKMVRAGIENVCVHKGLVPGGPDEFAHFDYAKVDDVGPAARDWPQLNFIIYHSAIKPLNQLPQSHLAKFRETGRIDWVSDLAEIPEKYGVDNVYGEVGTAFASSCITHPRHAAALLGILIRGLGPDRVLWGTDSVWYGSPQWQIDALRRMEIPEDMRREYGFSGLGGPDSEVKRKILAENSARLHGWPASPPAAPNDRLTEFKRMWAQGEDGRREVTREFLEPAEARRQASVFDSGA